MNEVHRASTCYDQDDQRADVKHFAYARSEGVSRVGDSAELEHFVD